MQIDEIEIIPIKARQGHVGFCSFVLSGAVYLSGIAVYTRPQGGYRLVYPTKLTGNIERSIFYPINKEFGQELEERVGEAFEKVMKNHVGYSCTDLR